MKNILFAICMLIQLSFFAQKYNSQNTIILKRKAIDTCSIQHSTDNRDGVFDTIIYEGLNSTIKVNMNIIEPQSLWLFCEKTRSAIHFFIEKGTHAIYLDVDNLSISSPTSKLNNEMGEVFKFKKKYDTLFDNARKNKVSEKTFDSILYKYYVEYNNWSIKHPKSFAALDFSYFNAKHWFETYLSKSEINALYNKLDVSLKKYPTYKECKFFMDNYVNTEQFDKMHDTMNNVATPIWKSDTK